jgi:hypothetical protein
MEANIILFDVDGVLVQPGGYREAVRATIDYFGKLLNLSNITPDEDALAIFEAQGITCEWDMVPITLALALEAAWGQGKVSGPIPSLQAAADYLSACQPLSLPIDYPPLLRSLGHLARPGEAPSDILLALCEDGAADSLFPHIAGQGVLRELLANTRSPALSLTTRVFENYVLGDKAYQQTMNQPAAVRSESFLLQYDQPLLDAATRDWLLDQQRKGRLHMAAYTARPSRPVSDMDERWAVFFPEAEMALELVGLADIALVGSGQMGEAAWWMKEDVDHLVKPAPFHALTAVAAAWTGSRQTALDWMSAIYNLTERGANVPHSELESAQLPKKLHLHVFEDSPAGMRGAIAAADLLRSLSWKVDLYLWGVSTHPDKVAALSAVGATVSPDVNQAVARAFKLG